MLDLIFIPLLLVYFSVLTALFTYGANFLHLTWVAFRHRGARPPAREPATWPTVTVQLPVYNEMYVARRLIDAAANLDYPAASLEIQVLDDSTDETRAVIDAAVAQWSGRGRDIKVIRRPTRAGYKAGALAAGLQAASGEYLAIFDADFVPPPDFLLRTLPVLHADARLAFVQTRWGHTNASQSLLTRLQSLSVDGHFAVEQFTRWKRGYPFNFNGTAGVWRREALTDAGGWSHETLTEDLDVSYRAFMRGWRAAYLDDVESPAELPVSFDAYRRQQNRWARGSLQCAMKHIPSLWRSDLPWLVKLQGSLHLTGYSIHLLMLALCFLYPLLLLESSRYPALISLFGFMAAFNMAGLAPVALFTSAQAHRGRRWLRLLPAVLMLSLLGAGMMLTTARAAWQALSARPGAFERTPKFGLGGQRVEWMRLRYQTPVDLIVFAEIAVAAMNLATSYMAFSHGAWAMGLYTSVFGLGLLLTSGCTIAQAAGRRLKSRQAGVSMAEAPAITSAMGLD